MTVAARMARFVVTRSWDDISDRAREDLQVRVLDALAGRLDPAITGRREHRR